MTPKVSVIIPVYNGEQYLHECLDSVINQTLKEIEIICVDDGSTDNSPLILQEYKQKDDRVILLSQKNKGAGAARNAGLNIAKGEYLAILDGDDIYDVTMLEKMYNRADELQVDLIVCLAKAFDNSTMRDWDIPWSAIEIQKEVFSYKDTLEIRQNFDFFIGWSWDKLFKRSFVEQHGLRFQEISHSNDGFFVFLAMYTAMRITILRESLVMHRVNRVDSIEATHDKNPLCFSKMHKAIKAELEMLGVFTEVKERFVIWVLKHSLWVLGIIKTSGSFIKIYSSLQDNILPENEIDKLPSEIFDEKYLYDEMQKVVSQSAAEYLFDQRNVARVERDYLQGERDYLQGDRNRLQTEYDCLQTEQNELQSGYDHLQGERDQLQIERGQLQNEISHLQSDLGQLRSNYDQLHIDRVRLQDEFNNLQTERDYLQIERDYLQGDRDRLQVEREHLQGDRDRLQIERDHLHENLDRLQGEHNAVLSSFSFRLGRMLTWFPRKVRGFFRCLKENGFIYTIKHFAKKCLKKIGVI